MYTWQRNFNEGEIILSTKLYEGSTHKNKYDQSYVITKRLPERKLRIEFIDTGYITEIFSSNAHSVIDRSHIGFSKVMKYSIGDIIQNIKGESVEVLDYREVPKLKGVRYEHLLRFLDTGYEVWADCYNFKQGKTLDRLKPSVHGLGSIGYPPEETFPLKRSKEYKLWARMIYRCSDEYQETGYEDVSCSERWKRFDFFLEDIKELFNYESWKKNSEEINKNPYEIDKDILIKGNREYSKEACFFVEKKMNASFTSWQNKEDREIRRAEILKEMGINDR